MTVQIKGLHFVRALMIFFLMSLAYETVHAKNFNSNSTTNIENEDDKLPWWYGNNSPRISFAIQKAFFLEVGYSRYLSRYFKSSYHYHPLHCIYVSADISPTFNKELENIYGIKIGYELSGNELPLSLNNNWAIGVETKYLTDWNSNSWFIIPKAGISFHELNLFYGYNILKKQNHFNRLGNHHVTLIFNLRKPYIIE